MRKSKSAAKIRTFCKLVGNHDQVYVLHKKIFKFQSFRQSYVIRNFAENFEI